MTILVAVALTLAGPAHAAMPPVPDPLAEAGTVMGQVAVFVHQAEADTVMAAMADMAERFGRWLDEITPPPPPHPPVVARVDTGTRQALPNAGGGGGDCYDGPIPAYIVTRESGGNPAAVNTSSGAYGCFQIMPYVWAANCGDLDRGVAGQIACAGRISNGGTNLAPWAG